MEPEVIDQFT